MNINNGVRIAAKTVAKTALLPACAVSAILAGCMESGSGVSGPDAAGLPAAAATASPDHLINNWNGSSWVRTANGGGIKIAVDPANVPWIINTAGDVWKKNDATLGSYFTQIPGKALDLDIGANGAVWKLGTTKIPNTNDYYIFKWNGSTWDQTANGGGVKITVAPDGIPWIINSLGDVWKKNDATLGSYFTQVTGKATDIDIGKNGAVWKLGTTKVPGTNDFYIYKWNGSTWDQTANGGGVKIAVDANGIPWVINSVADVWRKNDAALASYFTNMPGTALDIDIGATGSVWSIGTAAVFPAPDYRIFNFSGGSFQQTANGGAVKIAVNPQGVPWVINSVGDVWKKNDATLASYFTQMPSQATDLDIGKNGAVWKLGTAKVPGTNDFYIYKWNGAFWEKTANGGGVKITVDPNGIPWIINSLGDVWKKNDATLGSYFTQVTGKATDLDIGGNGSVWKLGTTKIPGTNDFYIYKWNGSSWGQTANGGGVEISVDGNGIPWIINSLGDVWKKNDATLASYFTKVPGKAMDIDISSAGSVWSIGTSPLW